MKKGKIRIITGWIMIALQFISLSGNLKSGVKFNLSFDNLYSFLFDLLFFCGYFICGIIGFILLISGIISFKKSSDNSVRKNITTENLKSIDNPALSTNSENREIEVKELELKTSSVKNEVHNNVCKKCGASLLKDDVFCHYCGKKIRRKTKEIADEKVKKYIKKIFLFVIIIMIVLCIIGVVMEFYTSYMEKQDSYDLTTANSSSYDISLSAEYAYEIKNIAGNKLSDVFHMEDNLFIRVIIHDDVVYVMEKGVYEVNGQTLTLQNEKGEQDKYLIHPNGYLIKNYLTYDNIEIPKKDTFSLETNKEYRDVVTNVKFSDDGSYQKSVDKVEYQGKYIRNGCIIDGISEDISGSHKWIVYDGQLIDNFFVVGGVSSVVSERVKYEFYKYMRNYSDSMVNRIKTKKFIEDYEKTHPISLNK